MSKRKILEVINKYEKDFEVLGIQKQRISLNKNWSLCSKEELLGHAYYLIDGIKESLKQKGKKGKVGRHLGSIQTILMVTGLQTLEDSMNHNKP